MTSGRRLAAALVLAALGAASAWLARGALPSRPVATPPALSIAEALGGGSLEGYTRALAPRALAFPRDHGPHPEFRTEWWYYTGNLRARDGRDFGFQLTFFRSALSPAPAPRASAWAASQVYLAHLALTDVQARRFRAWSRSGRAALGLAGAHGAPYRVWVDRWTAEAADPRGLPMRLRAAEDDLELELELDTTRPVVLQGDAGLSRKGAEPGNASYYYSLTRLRARGAIRVGGERLDVDGLAWMDHEWSTSALSADLAGWDWFALQLDDGRDLMLYRLRKRDGAPSAWSAGTLAGADGAVRALSADDVAVEVLDTWTSPRSGIAYPARWRLRWPAADLVLEVTPRLPDQELDVGLRYWEGAVSARGTERGTAVAGRGYVELVGYGPVSAPRSAR